MIFRTTLGTAIAVAMLAATATAHASSIAFIRDGDVWLTTPDHSREHRVTTGGSFMDVTQADDGRLFATAGGILHSYAPDGRRLAGPTGTGSTFDLDVNPDGSKLAFWYLTSGGGRYTVINSDGSPAPEWDDQNGWYASWIRNDLVLQSNGAGWLETSHAGLGGYQIWTGRPEGFRFHSSAITRANDRLVAVIRDYDDVGPWAVAHYSNSSQPPVEPQDDIFAPPPEDQQPTHRCTTDYGAIEPSHPSFSPDGASIAWELPGGVQVQPVLDLASCSQPPGGFTIAGARSPDWGPADLPPPVTQPEPEPVTAKRCVVPKVKGKKLRKAKRMIRKAGCRLGAVRKVRSKKRRGIVLKQRPAAGRKRPVGAKVKLTVSRGRR